MTNKNSHLCKDNITLYIYFSQVNVLSDAFSVETLDVVGWSNNHDTGVISLSYVEQAQISFASLVSFPVTGEVYNFDFIPLPAEFSMAVKVITGEHIYS